MQGVERRSFVRVPFESTTVVRSQTAMVDGTIKNVCLAGAFINTPEMIPLDTHVEVAITPDKSPPDVDFTLSAKVVRLVPEGLGLQFTGMSPDVYGRLRDIIGDRLGDKAKMGAGNFAFTTEELNLMKDFYEVSKEDGLNWVRLVRHISFENAGFVSREKLKPMRSAKPAETMAEKRYVPTL